MKKFNIECNGDTYVLTLGQNATENWNIIDNANTGDLWFHVDGIPSGHLIIECISKKMNESKDYPYKLCIDAGKICKTQSKLKNEKCKVVYTTIKNIKKGTDVGSVIIKNEKYITV